MAETLPFKESSKSPIIDAELINTPGIRNRMVIKNGTGVTITFHEHYLHWGKVKEPPSSMLDHCCQDEALFHATGGLNVTGSSGIVTYQLDSDTFLHIMWNCPFSFTFSNNFAGLYLCCASLKEPTGDLFKKMYQDVAYPEMTPAQCSSYDLVCCGPGDGTFLGGAGVTGQKTWGVRRPCEVKNDQYHVTMTMGDTYATSSEITILGKKFWSNNIVAKTRVDLRHIFFAK